MVMSARALFARVEWSGKCVMRTLTAKGTVNDPDIGRPSLMGDMGTRSRTLGARYGRLSLSTE